VACTWSFGLVGAISGGPGDLLNWLVRPLDGPSALLLAIAAACGLLGLAWRRRAGL
jgi:hypothetical protein